MFNIFSGLGRARRRIRDAAAMLGLAFIFKCFLKSAGAVRSHLLDRVLDLCKVKKQKTDFEYYLS